MQYKRPHPFSPWHQILTYHGALKTKINYCYSFLSFIYIFNKKYDKSINVFSQLRTIVHVHIIHSIVNLKIIYRCKMTMICWSWAIMGITFTIDCSIMLRSTLYLSHISMYMCTQYVWQVNNVTRFCIDRVLPRCEVFLLQQGQGNLDLALSRTRWV